MNVYSLGEKAPESGMPSRNDANTHLSELQLVGDELRVPMHIFEDALVDAPPHLADAGQRRGRHVIYPASLLDAVQDARRHAYSACKWYPVLEAPTALSVLHSPADLADAEDFIARHLDRYPFVRTCYMSPKDVRTVPLFTSAGEAIEILFQSCRTSDLFDEPHCEGGCRAKHLFMREAKRYEWEVRCFWSRGALTAVSLDEGMDEADYQSVVDFFERWGPTLPYNSAIVDVGRVVASGDQGEGGGGGGVELIEFNTFGPDMNATAGYFSWYEDVMLLLSSTVPVFRGPDNYEWRPSQQESL
jgi:hypothetical protein